MRAVLTSWPNVIAACVAAVALGGFLLARLLRPERPASFGQWLRQAKIPDERKIKRWCDSNRRGKRRGSSRPRR